MACWIRRQELVGLWVNKLRDPRNGNNKSRNPNGARTVISVEILSWQRISVAAVLATVDLSGRNVFSSRCQCRCSSGILSGRCQQQSWMNFTAADGHFRFSEDLMSQDLSAAIHSLSDGSSSVSRLVFQRFPLRNQETRKDGNQELRTYRDTGNLEHSGTSHMIPISNRMHG